MGLRVEPKVKPFDPKLYQKIQSALLQGQAAASNSDVYWDLDPEEEAAKVKKDLTYVAESEGIGLKVTKPRQGHYLVLEFDESTVRKRLPAEETRSRIIAVLSDAKGPMKKKDILALAQVSQATWNMRIRELVEQGQVVRTGSRRDTVYTLA